jgi:hypothetical protein
MGLDVGKMKNGLEKRKKDNCLLKPETRLTCPIMISLIYIEERSEVSVRK